jgi:hypothetical protein
MPIGLIMVIMSTAIRIRNVIKTASRRRYRGVWRHQRPLGEGREGRHSQKRHFTSIQGRSVVFDVLKTGEIETVNRHGRQEIPPQLACLCVEWDI